MIIEEIEMNIIMNITLNDSIIGTMSMIRASTMISDNILPRETMIIANETMIIDDEIWIMEMIIIDSSQNIIDFREFSNECGITIPSIFHKEIM